MIDYFLQSFCEKDRDYMVYSPIPSFSIGQRTVDAKNKVAEETGTTNGHAGAYETAVSLYLFPHCVKPEMMLPRECSVPNKRFEEMRKAGLKVPTWWFAAHPNHYGGFGGNVTAEHGKEICDAIVQDIVDYVRAIKADNTTMEIYSEFRKKSRHPEL